MVIKTFQRSSQNLIHNQQLDPTYIVSSTEAIVDNINEVINALFTKPNFNAIDKNLPVTEELSLSDFLKNSLRNIYMKIAFRTATLILLLIT